MSTTIRRSSARALTTVVVTGLAATVFSVPAQPATAAPVAPVAQRTTGSATATAADRPAVSPARSKAAARKAFGAKVVSTAATRQGKPYSYGGVGPSRFDCSGLTMWTFKKLGRKLPHSSAAQYGRTKHLRAKDRRRGDLVFFHNGGSIYHVGIYAGHNRIWHAPYSGTRVRKERIWSSSVLYGRVR